MLIKEKIFNLESNTFYHELKNNSIVDRYECCKMIIHDLMKRVDNIYLSYKDSAVFKRINLLKSNILVNIDVEKDSKLYEYGIQSFIIEFMYSGSDIDISKSHSFLYDEFVGNELIDYRVYSITASYKIYKYVHETFGNLINCDIIINDLNNESKLTVLRDSRIIFNIEKMNALSVFTNCNYNELKETNISNIQYLCFDSVEGVGIPIKRYVTFNNFIDIENIERYMLYYIIDVLYKYKLNSNNILQKGAYLLFKINVDEYKDILNISNELDYLMSNPNIHDVEFKTIKGLYVFCITMYI